MNRNTGCLLGVNGAFTLVELLVVILIIGILLALVIPSFVLVQERARRGAVRRNMHVVQTALEAYSIDHGGCYPLPPTATDNFVYTKDRIGPWFPGGDPVGIDGEPKAGDFPVNPYDGREYNSQYKSDLNYDELYGDLDPGQMSRTCGGDEECPYIDFGWQPPYPGGIGIATHVPDIGPGLPTEYGIYGFGREVSYPMYDLDPACLDPADEDHWVFFVLHN